MDFKQTLSFDDVLLTPLYSSIESRGQVDISSALDEKTTLSMPVISSPMDTVTEQHMAASIGKAGGMGIIHRYNTPKEQATLVAASIALDRSVPVGVAVGMTGDYIERARKCVMAGADVVCIDVAHGHHAVMERCLKSLKDTIPGIHLMAGNVATLEAFDALASWGADSIRVGIGGGSICSTRMVTGHGLPTFQSVLECSRTTYETKIIADGGIKTTGDMVKALAAGADFVMVGSMLAGTKETPGEIFVGNIPKRAKNTRYTEEWHRQQRRNHGGASLPHQRVSLPPFRIGVVLKVSLKILLVAFAAACLIQAHEAWKSFEAEHLSYDNQVLHN